MFKGGGFAGQGHDSFKKNREMSKRSQREPFDKDRSYVRDENYSVRDTDILTPEDMRRLSRELDRKKGKELWIKRLVFLGIVGSATGLIYYLSK